MAATEWEFSKARSCCCSSSDQTRYSRFCVIPIWRANLRHASRGCPDSLTSDEISLPRQIGSPAVSRDNSMRTISRAPRDHLNARRRPTLTVAGHIALDSGASHGTRPLSLRQLQSSLCLCMCHVSAALSQTFYATDALIPLRSGHIAEGIALLRSVLQD
jgi:hypothetical protein